MLSERLKEETYKAHIDVEKLLIRRFKTLDNYSSYGNLLKLFYGFFHPLEQKVQQFVTKDLITDIEERRKTGSLLADISFINGQSTALTLNEDLPEILNNTQALGAMYVMEGSTLGGVHLSKMVREKLGLTSDEGVQFFDGYKGDNLVKWQSFQKEINLFAIEHEAEDEIILSANNTFLKLKKWIEKN